MYKCQLLSSTDCKKRTVFTRLYVDGLRKEFENTLDLINQRPLALEALLNASVPRIVAVLFEKPAGGDE